MRLWISLVFLLTCSVSLAVTRPANSDAPSPEIVPSAADAASFVPEGWTLEHKAFGDLNGDGSGDAVLVLRHPYKPADATGNDDASAPFDPMRRILVVAFREKDGDRYRLVHENRRIIPDRFSANVEDHLEGPDPLTIRNRVLRLRLDVFMSAGGWETSSRTFSFRFQDRRFALIGFDRTITHRGTGKLEELSINYLTGKAKLGEGSIEDDAMKVTWKKIPRRGLPSIGDVGDGLEFDPGF